MPFNVKTTNKIVEKMAVWERHLFTALFLAAYALAFLRLWWHFPLPGKPGWLVAVLLLLAVGTTIAALARHLPLPNVLFAACLIALAGGAAAWLDLKTGIPFGPLTFSDNVEPKLRETLPWAVPLIWVVAVLNSRGVARLVLRPWRKTHNYGFWLIGLTAGLTALFSLAFDPFASCVKRYWIWEPTKFPLSWHGAPLVNFFGWAVVTLLILAFVTPLLINKHPIHRPPPDFHPLGVWLGGILLFGAGCASAGLWSTVALDVISGVAVAAFAIRGARW